jgi:post-segregation antitoxin (ccd killing protein)
MKTKLTITVDEELVPKAKRYARERGVSLSSLIEDALERMTAPEEATSFVERWRGSMRLAERDDDRYRALIDKYGE